MSFHHPWSVQWKRCVLWGNIVSVAATLTVIVHAEFRWQPAHFGRLAPLASAGNEEPGFELMTPHITGLSFSNILTQAYSDRNQNLVGSGIAIGDVNGDDLCDIFFASMNSDCKLFLNLGDWKFKDVTTESGLQLKNQLATGALLEDLDADGDLDLVVGFNGSGIRWWSNDGRSRFKEVTPRHFRSRTGPTSMAVADVDQNGLLDLYVANYGVNTIRSGAAVNVRSVRGKQVVTGRWKGRIEIIDGNMVEFGEPDHLFMQTSRGVFHPASWTNGTFRNAQGKALPTAPRDLSLSVMIRDLNRDQLPDIYECNDFQSPDRIWINQGKGKFQAIQDGAIRSMSHFSMGMDAADVNRDGWDDLYVVDMLSRIGNIRMIQRTDMSPNPRHLSQDELQSKQLRRNTLLVNRGDGTYAELARLAGVEATDWSWCPIFLDVDLDGWEDLLVVNGHLMDALDSDIIEKRAKIPDGSPQKKQIRYPPLITPNVAFRNEGGLRFTSMGDTWGFYSSRISSGFSMGDLDLDGDMDLVVNCLNDQALIYRNKAAGPRIAVKLVGLSGNTSAIGSRIALICDGFTLEQEIIGGGRYLSDDQNMRSFAMTTDPAACSLRITWPDGSQSQVNNLKSNTIYEIDASRISRTPRQPEGDKKITPLFAPSGPPLTIERKATDTADWDWQPSVNRPLRDRATHASVVREAEGPRESLLIEHRDATSQQTEKATQKASQPRAYAWINASRQIELELVTELPTKPFSPIQTPAPLAVADINQDGYPDVFVGMPPLPGPYPLAKGSRLYWGSQEGWNEIETAAPWSSIGNVRDAIFADFDQDGWPDLALACDWAPILIFKNNQGQFTETTDSWKLSDLTGWWKTLLALDADHDGDTDLVAGNWGRNTRYQPYIQDGLRLYVTDTNQDGILETMEAWFDSMTNTWRPFDGLSEQERVFPGLRSYYPTHRDFAKTSMDALNKQLGFEGHFLEINTLDSMLLINQGNEFEALPLPMEAQYAPIQDMVSGDFNQDGEPDLFLAQNWENPPPHLGRIDAGQGLVLLGSTTGQYVPLSSKKSGIRIDRAQKAAWVGDANGDNRTDLWVESDDGIQLYLNQF